MKNTFFFFCSVFSLLFSSCGPASEDRNYMHARAKVFQDSIANFIRASMAEAEAPANNGIPAMTPPQTPSPAPTATVK